MCWMLENTYVLENLDISRLVNTSMEKNDQNDKDASQESQTQPHSGGGMSMMVRQRDDPNGG